MAITLNYSSFFLHLLKMPYRILYIIKRNLIHCIMCGQRVSALPSLVMDVEYMWILCLTGEKLSSI